MLNFWKMSLLDEASRDASTSNRDSVSHQSPPGFEEGLCAIRVSDGAVRYVSGWDRYHAACKMDHVCYEMRTCNVHLPQEMALSLHQIAEKICSPNSKYRQVYVVLSKLGIPWDICYFIQAQARDDLLPFMITPDGKALQPWPTEEEEANKTLTSLVVPGWDQHGRHLEFYDVQWEQLALVFQTGENYELHVNAFVPLVQEVPERRLNGIRSAVLRPRNYDFSGVNEVPDLSNDIPLKTPSTDYAGC